MSADRVPAMTLQEIARLPAVVDVVTAARALGVGRTTAYALARTGEFPCPVIQVGSAYKVPTAGLLRVLGLADIPIPRSEDDPDDRDDRADHGADDHEDRDQAGLGLPRDLPAARA
jgi:hypothetical protein